jgi:hypothetical protein
VTVADRDEFKVTLTADGAGPPAHVRLKRWLKTALRAHGLRCTRVEPAVDAEPEEQPEEVRGRRLL